MARAEVGHRQEHGLREALGLVGGRGRAHDPGLRRRALAEAGDAGVHPQAAVHLGHAGLHARNPDFLGHAITLSLEVLPLHKLRLPLQRLRINEAHRRYSRCPEAATWDYHKRGAVEAG